MATKQPKRRYLTCEREWVYCTLIAVAGTDDVASAYAATYPIALVSVVLASQFLTVLFR